MRWLSLCLLLLTLPAFAEPEPPKVDEKRFREIANLLRCPTCQGLSVLESEAQFSVQIRDQVKKQMEEGKSQAEILGFFTDRYGPWILRTPPSDGINALVWWGPIALLVLGPILIWIFVWRHRQTVPSFGVRSSEVIVSEMMADIEVEKKKRGLL